MRSKGSNKRPITAAELMTQLEQDPEFVRRREEREKQRQQIIEINKQAAAPVLAELARAGFSLSSISDLSSKRLNYRDAIPILLRWLPRIDNPDVKRAIVEALAVPWAKPQAASALIEEFRKANDPGEASIKWAIANALSIVADGSVFTDIVELVQDAGNGKAREMLAIALGNMKDPNAVRVLIDLLDDDEVAGHAVIALGKLKAKEARRYIERFLNHPKAWVRKEAKRALIKIDKANEN